MKRKRKRGTGFRHVPATDNSSRQYTTYPSGSTASPLPGVSLETLRKAGVLLTNNGSRGVDLGYIHYDINGEPTGLTRWRRKGSTRQEKGKPLEAYLALQLPKMEHSGDLVVVEKESCALALIDAGFPAVAIPSIYCYSRGKRGIQRLLPGLGEAIDTLGPERIFFLSGSKSVVNIGLACSGVFLADELAGKGISVSVLSIPLDGPRPSVDTCKETLGDEFAKWWRELAVSGVGVIPGTNRHELAGELVERQIAPARRSRGKSRERMSVLAAEALQRTTKDSRFRRGLHALVDALTQPVALRGRPADPATPLAEAKTGKSKDVQSLLAQNQEFRAQILELSDEPIVLEIRSVFVERDTKAISTEELLTRLSMRLTASSLAKSLRPFGIKPERVSIDGKRYQGYRRQSFVSQVSEAVK